KVAAEATAAAYVASVAVGAVNLLTNLQSNWVQGVRGPNKELIPTDMGISCTVLVRIPENTTQVFYSDTGNTFVTVLELDLDGNLLRRRYNAGRGLIGLIEGTRRLMISVNHNSTNIAPSYITAVKAKLEIGNKPTSWSPSTE